MCCNHCPFFSTKVLSQHWARMLTGFASTAVHVTVPVLVCHVELAGILVISAIFQFSLARHNLTCFALYIVFSHKPDVLKLLNCACRCPSSSTDCRCFWNFDMSWWWKAMRLTQPSTQPTPSQASSSTLLLKLALVIGTHFIVDSIWKGVCDYI